MRLSKIDAALALYCPLPGEPIDQYTLAEMLGCTRGNISMIECRALAKLRARAPHLADYLEGRG